MPCSAALRPAASVYFPGGGATRHQGSPILRVVASLGVLQRCFCTLPLATQRVKSYDARITLLRG